MQCKNFTPLFVIKLYKTIAKLQIKSPKPKFDETIPGPFCPFELFNRACLVNQKKKAKASEEKETLHIMLSFGSLRSVLLFVFLTDETSSVEESKRKKHAQGRSRQILGFGILFATLQLSCKVF